MIKNFKQYNEGLTDQMSPKPNKEVVDKMIKLLNKHKKTTVYNFIMEHKDDESYKDLIRIYIAACDKMSSSTNDVYIIDTENEIDVHSIIDLILFVIQENAVYNQFHYMHKGIKYIVYQTLKYTLGVYEETNIIDLLIDIEFLKGKVKEKLNIDI